MGLNGKWIPSEMEKLEIKKISIILSIYRYKISIFLFIDNFESIQKSISIIFYRYFDISIYLYRLFHIDTNIDTLFCIDTYSYRKKIDKSYRCATLLKIKKISKLLNFILALKNY